MGSETYVKVEEEKLVRREGVEPSTSGFRSRRSEPVELTAHKEETYVGLMPVSFAVVMFFIMSITITQFVEMSNTFAKNRRLLREGVDNERLSLLLPTRIAHYFLGN